MGAQSCTILGRRKRTWGCSLVLCSDSATLQFRSATIYLALETSLPSSLLLWVRTQCLGGSRKSAASELTCRLLPLCRVVAAPLCHGLTAIAVFGYVAWGSMGCLATWALWVLTGMTAGYPVAKDSVFWWKLSGTLVFCYRWPILTAMVCCIRLPLMSGGMGADDNLSNLI